MVAAGFAAYVRRGVKAAARAAADRPAARKIGLAVLWLVTLASFAPLVSLLGASLVAGALGCPLDEGSVHPCLVAGSDLGDSLYAAALLGWLMLATWPGMLASLAVWLWLIGRRLLRAGKASAEVKAGRDAG